MAGKIHHLRHKKSNVILIILLLGILEISYSVYASEFGGFDISTGTGEDNTDWSDWDDTEPSYDAQEQENSNYSVNENEIQESNENMTDVWQNSDENSRDNTEQEWNERNESTEVGNNQLHDQSQTSEITKPEQNTSSASVETMPSEALTQLTMSEPTLTPTPLPTATVTPAPVFTEVPVAEEHKIIEFSEEYRLPPTECRQKMCMFYWKEEAPGGDRMEICMNYNITLKIMSVRVNGQETEYRKESEKLIVSGLSEERNILELAIMVPSDLSWTENKKNVILSYNIF